MTPKTQIEVVGTRATLRFQAIIDTGFTGDLSLPTDIAVGLGLELVARRWTTLADGSTHTRLAFAGKVRFLDEEVDVEINVSDLNEPLIGTRLLEDCRLTIDFASETVLLKRSPKKGRRR